MEVKIRGLDKSTILAIDDIARKQGKSRNEFLKQQINFIAESPTLRKQEDRYERIIKEITEIIQRNTEILEKLLE